MDKIPIRNENHDLIDYAIIDQKNYNDFISRIWYIKDEIVFTCIDNRTTSMQSLVMKGRRKRKYERDFDVILHLNNNILDNRENNLIYSDYNQLIVENGHKFENENICFACLDEFRNCKYMPCGHIVFCMNCAIKIWKIKKICPLCRKQVVNPCTSC